MSDAVLHHLASSSEVQPSFITTAYSELCRSYQGLREFRMKLLGFLPIASVVGLVALGKALPSSPQPELRPEVVGYIGIFSAIFTLALFGYEVRSLLMCHDYSRTGANLEAAMGIHGQFARCDENRDFMCYQGVVRRPLARLINDKVTSSLVYSFVFSSWFFVGLKWTFGLETEQCVRWAVAIGATVAAAALLFLTLLTRESKERVVPESDGAVFVIVGR
jgi:hypothetical protein